MKVLWVCSMTMMIALALAQFDWYPCNKCLCLNTKSGKKYNCHGVEVTLQEKLMRIVCPKSEKGKTNYTFLWENIDIKNIGIISIRNCSLPDGAIFGEIGKSSWRGGVWDIYIYDYGIHGWSALTKDHFQNLPELSTLNIKGNTNLNLTDDFFEANPKVYKLELNLNQVHLSADVFSPLTILEYLSIHTKHKLIVPGGLFKHSLLIKYITLRQEHVTLTNEVYNTLTLIEWPGYLVNLTISGTFPVLGKLTYHHLKFLPMLFDLELSRLSITKIDDDAFRAMPYIGKLDLRGNQLTTIDSSVFRFLPQLKFLYLNENRISSFKIDGDGLKNVKYINLNHNRLKKFDLLRLRSLDKLEINNNLLNSLKITRIIHLDVSYNILNEESFDYNRFDYIEMNYLNISHNYIKRIKFINDNFYRRIALNVGKLDLSFNSISTISTDDMNFLSKSARSTDLRYNHIRKIDPINVIELGKAATYSTVDIRDIPFDCTCSVYDLVQYLNSDDKPLYIIIGNSTCSSPLSMKGRLLKDFKVCDVVCDELYLTCPKNCHCYRRPCDSATLATCLLQTMLLFPPEIRKLELTIQNSTFDPRLIDEATFQKVSKLSIANSNILKLTVQHIPDNIQVLDLRNNAISHVDEDVVNKLSSLKTIYISGNKIVCHCDNQPLLTLIQNKLSIFKDVQDEKCFNDNELIRLVSIADLCGYRKAYTIAGIVVAILVFIIITCVALYYKYQTEVKVWLFAKGWFVSWVTEEELDKDKVFDAFLAWSHKDDEFVLNEILSKLEEGPTPFKICVHYRDWEVGEMINTQINRSIKQSRRTLVVLTPNFLKSPWGMYEFKQAHCYALEESRVRVIVICHGDLGPRDQLDPDLQAYLATRTYIEWGNARFWEKLMYALPHPTGRTDTDGTFYYRSGMVQFRRRA